MSGAKLPLQVRRMPPSGIVEDLAMERSALRPGATFDRLDSVEAEAGGTTSLAVYPARKGCEDLVMISARAVGICILLLWLTNFLVSQFFPVLLGAFGASSFWLYAGFSLLAFVFICLRLPETRGKTLEEITATEKTEST